MGAQNKRFHHQEYPRNQGDDHHHPVIFLDLCDPLNKPFEKCQKRKFDGENCGPDERKKGVKICV